MKDQGGTEDLWSIERNAFKGGSPMVLLILLGISAFCLFILWTMVSSGDPSPIGLILFSAYPILVIPWVVMEVRQLLPAKLEITKDSARYFVNGKLREEITFGPDATADVKLTSNRIGPEPKAFHNSCAADPAKPSEEGFLLLCGISLSRGDRAISLSVDEGWQLIDFGSIWEGFISVVLDHEMEVGDEMWRYLEFRKNFQRQGASFEPDLFSRFRAMEI
jgi:hypothetical protein